MQTVRVNTVKQGLIKSFIYRRRRIVVEKSEVIPECIYITNGQAARTTAFQNGFITIQDESSMIPANALQV